MSLLEKKDNDLPTLNWISRSPLEPGGFSNVTANLMSRLDGYNINVLSLVDSKPQLPLRTSRYDLYQSNSPCGLRHWIENLNADINIVYGAFTHLHHYLKAVGNTTDRVQLAYVVVEAPPIINGHIKTLPLFDKVMTPCIAAAQTIVDTGHDAHVLHHGVDGNIFKPDPTSSGSEKFTYGAVKANNFKGQLGRILWSYNQICRDIDSWLLYHTNPSDGRGFPLKSMVETYKIEDYVKFRQAAVCGVGLSGHDMNNFYNNMDVFVSASGADTCNLPAVEAGRAGTPVIAADVPGPKEYLGDGAIYIPTNEVYPSGFGDIRLCDKDILANTMKMLYNDESLRVELGKKAVAHTKQFTWDKAIGELKYHLKEFE